LRNRKQTQTPDDVTLLARFLDDFRPDNSETAWTVSFDRIS
jgi:hypothetical protein